MDLGFTFNITKAGDLIIYHHQKRATILRGGRAQQVQTKLAASTFEAQQQLMARLTGNYKRGNERAAKNHRRNQ